MMDSFTLSNHNTPNLIIWGQAKSGKTAVFSEQCKALLAKASQKSLRSNKDETNERREAV